MYGIAIVVDRLTGFVTLPLLTSTMDRSVYGAWTQVLTAFALLSNILELGFYHSIVRYVPGAPRAEVGRILHGMLAIFAGNSAVFVLIAFFAPDLVSRLLFAAPAQPGLILMTAVFLVTECLFEFLVLAFLRADGQIRVGAVYYAIRNLLRLALLWQGVSAGADLSGLLARLAVANVALASVAYAVNIAPSIEFGIGGLRRGFWPDVIRHSIPIVLSGNLSWANASLNRFLIVYLLGLAELGIYAANYSIASIVTLASLVINFTVVPHLNNAWNLGDKARVRSLLSKVTAYYIFATVPVAVAIGVFYVPLARLLTSPQYIAGPLLIWSLVLFIVLLGLEQLMTLATFLDNSRFSVVTRSISLAVNIILNLALLKTFGIVASAVAAVVSTLAVVGFNVGFLHRMTGYEFPWRSLSATLTAAGAMGIVGWAAFAAFPAQTFAAAVAAGLISLPVYIGIESLWRGSVNRQLFAISRAIVRGEVF